MAKNAPIKPTANTVKQMSVCNKKNKRAIIKIAVNGMRNAPNLENESLKDTGFPAIFKAKKINACKPKINRAK